jgi:hypothetical protein
VETAHDILLGSLVALGALVVIIGFTFAFVVAPLLAGGGFVLALVLFQAARRGAERRR